MLSKTHTCAWRWLWSSFFILTTVLRTPLCALLCRDHLSKALRAAKRTGLGSPASARELLELQQAAAATGATASAGSSAGLGGRDPEAEGSEEPEAGNEAVVPRSQTAPLGRSHLQGQQTARDWAERAADEQQDGRVLEPAAGRASGSDPAPDTWQMRLPPGGVQLVVTAEQVHAMQREVLGGLEVEIGLAAAAACKPWQVVAIDCEWAPFERNQPKTPVSILQVSKAARRAWLSQLYGSGPLTPGEVRCPPSAFLPRPSHGVFFSRPRNLFAALHRLLPCPARPAHPADWPAHVGGHTRPHLHRRPAATAASRQPCGGRR